MVDKKINGFISVTDSEYSFCLDENKLYGNLLNGKDGMNYYFHDRNQIPFIKARNSAGCTMAFYNFSYSKEPFDNSLFAKSYGVFTSRLIDRDIDSYEAISFKGNAVNKFYPPALSIEGIGSFEYPSDDGSKTIKIKPFLEKSDEIEAIIYEKNVKIKLSVCTPGSIGIDSTNLGEIYTSFRVIFQEKMPLKDLMKWVLAIKKIFAFLYFRNDIAFEEIELLANTDRGFAKIGNLYLYENFENDIPKESSKCVKFSNIKEHFSNLFRTLLDEKLNLLCLPSDKRDSRLVSPEKYVFTCASFENIFDKRYHSFIDEDKDCLTIKNRLISFLDQESITYKGKNSKARKWINKIKDTIERESKNLNHKFNKCLEDYSSLLSEFKTDIHTRYNIVLDETIDLGQNFSSVRNRNAHGSKTGYNDESIIAFEFARVMIYIMVLKEAKFSDEEITNIIKILFIG